MRDSHQRLVVGGLLVACILFVVIGGGLWSAVSSDIHTSERIYAACPSKVSEAGDCPFVYESVVTGSRPNRIPAVLAFVVGGVAGLLGVVLIKSRPSTATSRTLLHTD